MTRSEQGSASMVAMGLGAVALAAVGGWWLMSQTSPAPAMDTAAGEVDSLRAEVAQLRGDMAELADYVERRTAEIDRPSRVEDPVAKADGEGSESGADEAGGPGSGEERGGRGGRGGFGGMTEGFEDMRKLRELEDPAERIALALKLLEDENPMASGEAIRVLLELDPAKGVAAVRDLVAAIDPEDRRGGWSATRAIAELGNVEGYAVTSDLVAMYEDGNEDVRRAAARALDKQGDSSLIMRELNGYTAALGSNDARERLGAIEDIGNTRSPAAAPLLVPYLTNGDSETRIRALEALGRSGDDSYIKSVEALLNDPVAAVRDRAVRTIESLRTPLEDRNTGRGGFGDRGGRGGGRGGR